MKVMSIVAWVLVGVLLIGVGALAFLNSQQSGRAGGLRDALSQVATTAGVQDLAPDAFKDAAALPDVLQKVQAAIQAGQQELATTKETLTASQTEASGAKAEVTTLKQGVEEQTAKAAAAAKELASKEEALAAAKTASDKAAEAMKAVEQQKTELEGKLESAKTQMTEETPRLRAVLEAALQQGAALEAAAFPADSSQGSEGELQAEAGAEAAMASSEQAEAVEEPVSMTEAEQSGGQITGQSRMFSLVRYSEESRTLFFRLLDGQALTYQDVPMNVVDQLVGNSETLDMMYRFKIQGAFKSSPPDSIVVRKYWKDQRHRLSNSDVRVNILKAPPVVKEEPAPAVAPAEEAVAAEAAPAAEAVVAPAAEDAPAEK
jgi:hypothetical protein